MAAQDNPQQISWGDADKDKDKDEVNRSTYRGAAAQVANAQEVQNIAQSQGGMGKQQYRNPLELNAAKMSFNTFGNKQKFQIITLELDESGSAKQKPEVVVIANAEEKIEDNKGKEERYTNDMSSFQTDEAPKEVLKALTQALVEYEQDMEVTVDEENNSIAGLVFVQDFFPLDFKFNIWIDPQSKQTRFELIRNEGDGMTAAKFMGDIQRAYFVQKENKDDKQEEQPKFSLISLSVDASKLDLPTIVRQASNDDETKNNQEEDSITKQELDEANTALSDNELPDAVDQLQYIHDRLKDNGVVSKDIVNHEDLVKNIINEAMKNKDIAISRGCLLILSELCSDEKIGQIIVQQHSLFDNLQGLLSNKYDLLRLYSVVVLSKLTSLKEWNLNKDGAQKMKKAVEEYQKKWKESMLANNPSINEKMFESIYKKLGECQ